MTSRGTIAVYYSPMMVAESGSFSPSAGKPAPVVSSWRQLNVPIGVISSCASESGSAVTGT